MDREKILDLNEIADEVVKIAGAKMLQGIRQEITEKLTDEDFLTELCPFGLCGEWYDGVADALMVVMDIINEHIKEDKNE